MNSSKLKHIGPKGSGYFCDVVQYINVDSKENYALKKLKKKHYGNSNHRYRLLREIHLLKVLDDCPEIIDLISDGNDKKKEILWYLMPFAEYNLYKYIKKNAQKLSLEDKFKFADQIISAIKFAHSKGILHRDISPNNVLVFENENEINIKVSDFGLGKDQESLSHYTGSSVNGYGQILYVAPEQREKLKDATFKSDIYSLGKLIYFIFTSKDPDNLKQFILSPLVSRATEDNSDDRYDSIIDFESHYTALKRLQFDQEIPIVHLSIKDFINSKKEIDWLLFHQIAINGTNANHIYDDFIFPVTTLFSDRNRITIYHNSIGSEFKSFAQKLSDSIDECLGTVGWPFSATGSFGTLLKEIVLRVNDAEVRLICLKQMWNLAFVSDQWSVQDDIEPLLNSQFITNDIEISLADFIQNKPMEIDVSGFNHLDLPPIIKTGIIQANENHKRSEREKNIDTDNWNF